MAELDVREPTPEQKQAGQTAETIRWLLTLNRRERRRAGCRYSQRELEAGLATAIVVMHGGKPEPDHGRPPPNERTTNG